jgi:hypothetical protein
LIETSLRSFLEQLGTLVNDGKNDIASGVLQCLKITLENLSRPENTFWKEADVLLNTPTMKKLAISDSRKLICILSQSKLAKEHLDSFFKD